MDNAMTATQIAAAHSHIRKIRNPAKRAYAVAYLAFLCGKLATEPERGTLAYMAAQGVRITFSDIRREAA